MKKLFLILALALIASPAFGLSYAGELTNGNETYSFIENAYYQGSDYPIYAINLGDSTSIIVIEDGLGNMVTDNSTYEGVFTEYWLQTIKNQNETISNFSNPWKGGKLLYFEAFNSRLHEKSASLNAKILSTESIIPQYQALVHNLTASGVYAPNSVDFLSVMDGLFWNASTLLSKSMFNSADSALEAVKQEGSKIDLDINSSLRLNEGSVALNSSLSMMREAMKMGYNTTAIETYYDQSSALINGAKDSYAAKNYDDMSSQVASVLDLQGRISSELESLKNPPSSAPTGFAIMDLSWAPYVLIVAVVGAAVAFIVIKRRKPITYIPY